MVGMDGLEVLSGVCTVGWRQRMDGRKDGMNEKISIAGQAMHCRMVLAMSKWRHTGLGLDVFGMMSYFMN